MISFFFWYQILLAKKEKTRACVPCCLIQNLAEFMHVRCEKASFLAPAQSTPCAQRQEWQCRRSWAVFFGVEGFPTPHTHTNALYEFLSPLSQRPAFLHPAKIASFFISTLHWEDVTSSFVSFLG